MIDPQLAGIGVMIFSLLAGLALCIWTIGNAGK
jgi:hypothetical protein